MNIKPIFIIIVSIFILGAITPQQVIACSCVGDISQEESFRNAEAVFMGEVVSIKSDGNLITEFLSRLFKRQFAPSHYNVVFDVTSKWKGDNTSTITVATAKQDTACGFGFEEGEEYLVYTNAGDFYNSEFSTSICSRTQLLEDAEGELQLLGEADIVHVWQEYVNKELGFAVLYPSDIAHPYEAPHPPSIDGIFPGAEAVNFYDKDSQSKYMTVWVQETPAQNAHEWFDLVYGSDGNGYYIKSTSTVDSIEAIEIWEVRPGKRIGGYGLDFVYKGNSWSLFIDDTRLSQKAVQYIHQSFRFLNWWEKL